LVVARSAGALRAAAGRFSVCKTITHITLKKSAMKALWKTSVQMLAFEKTTNAPSSACARINTTARTLAQ
jgi:hypothetical protein